MEHIGLGKPYKVSEHKHRQYQKHYEIPIEKCVVVPVKKYGDQISCDLRWKDESGVTNRREELMFSGVYLQPVDAIKDFRLYELWEEYTRTSETPAEVKP